MKIFHEIADAKKCEMQLVKLCAPIAEGDTLMQKMS